MDHAVLGNIHDLHELSARPLEAPARCRVFRVAGNPQGIKPKAPGQRDQQSNGAAGVVVTTVKRVNTIANVPGIHLYMARGPNAESDGTKLLTIRGVNHSEMIRRDFVYRVWCETDQLQPKIPILKIS
jgi:hypothetical protein